jgi:hypothetical protein
MGAGQKLFRISVGKLTIYSMRSELCCVHQAWCNCMQVVAAVRFILHSTPLQQFG